MPIFYCEDYPAERYAANAKEILGNPDLPFQKPESDEFTVEERIEYATRMANKRIERDLQSKGRASMVWQR